MKTILTLTLLIWTSAFCQQSNQKAWNKIISQYEASIKSDSPGVRSSAIYQIAQMKYARPDDDFSSFEWTLARVAKNDPSPLIRIHAELTLVYLQDAKLRNKIKADSELEMNDFYNQLYNEMYSSFVTLVVAN